MGGRRGRKQRSGYRVVTPAEAEAALAEHARRAAERRRPAWKEPPAPSLTVRARQWREIEALQDPAVVCACRRPVMACLRYPGGPARRPQRCKYCKALLELDEGGLWVRYFSNTVSYRRKLDLSDVILYRDAPEADRPPGRRRTRARGDRRGSRGRL